MKIEYDSATDTLTAMLREGVIAESDENKLGVILDYDEAGTSFPSRSRRRRLASRSLAA